jgi:hypothetical protein
MKKYCRMSLLLIILCQTILLAILTHKMAERPFTVNDMRNAYQSGCTIVTIPMTQESYNKCLYRSTMYGETLEEIMK